MNTTWILLQPKSEQIVCHSWMQMPNMALEGENTVKTASGSGIALCQHASVTVGWQNQVTDITVR
jgi:hypothetical protein